MEMHSITANLGVARNARAGDLENTGEESSRTTRP